MPFITSAVLLASICMPGKPGKPCTTKEVAHFANGDTGKQFCIATAGSVNSVGDEVGESLYYCVDPKTGQRLYATPFK